MVEDLAAGAAEPRLDRALRRRAMDAKAASESERLGFFARADEAKLRELSEQLFRQVEKTQEWAENHYDQLPVALQTAELVTINAYWRDFALHDLGQPFLSGKFPEASRNRSEILAALAVLDLPFVAKPRNAQQEQNRLTLRPESPVIVFHEEIREAPLPTKPVPLLVSQNFFQVDDRFRQENGEQVAKFVSEEFLTHTVYGCQVVVTNPTSTTSKWEVLTQIPVGAIAVGGPEATRGHSLEVGPFASQTIEYLFYFPAAGDYGQLPVHVARNAVLAAFAPPQRFHVVERRTQIDRTSWEYVSRDGTDEEVLQFLETAQLAAIPLDRIAFRMQERPFFLKTVELLRRRHQFEPTLWSYALKYQDVRSINEFLQHQDELVAACGEHLQSPLLTIDPLRRRSYEHLEYAPLVNARAHRLGPQQQILNDRFAEQYLHFLRILGYQRELSDQDRLAITSYLLLQDRHEDAVRWFAQVNRDRVVSQLQYDLHAAQIALLREEPQAAAKIAQAYASYPVDRWRKAFAAIAGQVAELAGNDPQAAGREDRTQSLAQQAAAEPTMEARVVEQQLVLQYRNLRQVTLRYYFMDVELLFSRNPFVRAEGGQFGHVLPNLISEVSLPEGQNQIAVPLPEIAQRANVYLEVSGGGKTTALTHYAHALELQIQQNAGQLRVLKQSPSGPLAKAYVKVYARRKDGSVHFYKDGYTDLRGKFEYAGLSTNELDVVERFAILVVTEQHGSLVAEAAPPSR